MNAHTPLPTISLDAAGAAYDSKRLKNAHKRLATHSGELSSRIQRLTQAAADTKSDPADGASAAADFLEMLVSELAGNGTGHLGGAKPVAIDIGNVYDPQVADLRSTVNGLEAAHEAALQAAADELKALEAAHEAALQAAADESKALKAAHEAATRAGDHEIDKLKAAHEAALQAAHEAATKSLRTATTENRRLSDAAKLHSNTMATVQTDLQAANTKADALEAENRTLKAAGTPADLSKLREILGMDPGVNIEQIETEVRKIVEEQRAVIASDQALIDEIGEVTGLAIGDQEDVTQFAIRALRISHPAKSWWGGTKKAGNGQGGNDA